jgi:hypothetical protein
VTSTRLPLGDPYCIYGGTKFVTATGDSYACNGGAALSPRDDPAKIETGALTTPYTGTPVPGTLPGGAAAQCVAVLVGPVVVTDLAVQSNNGSNQTLYFVAGSAATQPRWTWSYVLVATVNYYLGRSGDTGLNLAVRDGESMFVCAGHLSDNVVNYMWSGFRTP